MSQNLLSFLEGQLSSDVVARLSTFIGEPQVQTGTAALAVQQALLVAMTQKAASSHGVGELLGMLNSAGGTSLGDMAGLPVGTELGDLVHAGAPFATSLLGDTQTAVVEWLSAAIGIGRDSATSLLGLLSPVVLAGISRYLTSHSTGINASSITNVLGNQSAPLLANIPLGLAGALSMPGVAELTRNTRSSALTDNDTTDTGLEFLKWVLPLIALTALLVYVMSRRSAVDETIRTASAAALTEVAAPAAGMAIDTSALDADGTAAAADLGALVDRSLPNLPAIRVPENGTESKLLAFITDTTRAVDSTTWFTFDRLEFDTASATLRPASNAQLDAVAAILKAYPAVTLKIGGYTDNVGDDVVNLKLSSDRAEATKQALTARGIAARRLDTEGFGRQFPVASNVTEQGRQRNRRIDVRVTRK